MNRTRLTGWLVAAAALIPGAAQAQEWRADGRYQARDTGAARYAGQDRYDARRGGRDDDGYARDRNDDDRSTVDRNDARAFPQSRVERDFRSGRTGQALRTDRRYDAGRYGGDRYTVDRDTSRIYPGSSRDRRDFRGYDGTRWDRTWRSDRRYDYGAYRTRNRSAYRLPRYYAPRGYGYGYRRYSVGVTLGRGLYAQNYWIADPYAYRLPAARGPYRWVRYYNDALLIDIRTGSVVDSVNDLFW